MYYLTDKSDNTKEIQQSVKGFHFLKADIYLEKKKLRWPGNPQWGYQ